MRSWRVFSTTFMMVRIRFSSLGCDDLVEWVSGEVEQDERHRLTLLGELCDAVVSGVEARKCRTVVDQRKLLEGVG